MVFSLGHTVPGLLRAEKEAAPRRFFAEFPNFRENRSKSVKIGAIFEGFAAILATETRWKPLKGVRRPSQHQPTTTNQPPRRGGRPRWEPRAKHTLITLKLTPAKILGDTKYLPEYNLSCEKWWSPGEVAGGLSRSRSPPTTQNSYGGQNAVRRHSRELGGENRVVKTT